MIKLITGFLAAGMSFVVFAAAPVAPPTFDMQAVPLNQVVNLYYKEVTSRPYVVCNDVLTDTRLVSVRAGGKALDAAMLADILEVNGYEAKEKNGVVAVCKKADAKPEEPGETFIYRPMYRDVAYLVDLLNPLIKGTFANRRQATNSLAVGGASVLPSASSGGSVMPTVAPTASPSMKSGAGDDYLLFSGSERETQRLKKLLAQVDTATGEVVIKGYVYEVGKNSSEASALDMVASLLAGKIGITITGPTLGNALRIKTNALDIVASALNSDGHFKVVTSPYTRVRSGSTARFVVGSDVPVLGSILTNATGQAQQSIEYRSAGTIFEVSPRVRDKSIDVDLFQQISTFVATQTGVNGSPTLNKREIRTSLTVEDGEILVIGGLNDVKEDASKSGLWFLPFATSKSSSSSNTELLVILEVKRI